MNEKKIKKLVDSAFQSLYYGSDSSKFKITRFAREILKMAKQRYINTKFWDDGYIVQLDPVEKLIFIYFLTNPLTNICGIYEIALKRIAFDTGIERDMVIKILERFQKENKIHYFNGWLIIVNFPKYQDCDNPKIKIGIEKIIAHIPEDIRNYSLSIGYIYPSNYLNLNSNLNSNLNNTTEDGASSKTSTLQKIYIDFLEDRNLYNKDRYPFSKNGGIFKKLAKSGATEDQVRLALDRMAGDKWMGLTPQLLNAGLLKSRFDALISDDWGRVKKPATGNENLARADRNAGNVMVDEKEAEIAHGKAWSKEEREEWRKKYKEARDENREKKI